VLRTWDTSAQEQLAEVPVAYNKATAFAPGGRVLALSEERGVSLLDTQTGGDLLFIESWDVWRFLFSPDGRMLLGGHDKSISLVEVATGRERGQLNVPWNGEAAFSPDGRLLATPMPDGTIVVWDLAAIVGAGRKK
jgi:WD40 repeat protein